MTAIHHPASVLSISASWALGAAWVAIPAPALGIAALAAAAISACIVAIISRKVSK